MAEDVWLAEVDGPSPPKRRKRRYQRYPKPVCTSEQKTALCEHQKGI
jgi:hypothetical protein